MILTVILAIYGLSSRSLQVDSKYFTEQNALFWGLTFGFGYAGSIAMIAILLNDVATVLMLGHAITYLTLMYLHGVSIRQLPWNQTKNSESVISDKGNQEPEKPELKGEEDTEESEEIDDESEEIEEEIEEEILEIEDETEEPVKDFQDELDEDEIEILD